MTVTSDHHAARLALQNVSEPNDYERGVKWQDCGGRTRRSIRDGASPASALYLRDDRRSARGGISRENACPIPAGPAVPPPGGSTRAQPSWTARQIHRHADADRRYLADYRPPRPRLALPRRAHRPPLRTILLRRCPRPPRTDPDPALPGIRRPLGHRGVPGQKRPVHRVRTARLFRAGGRYPEQEVDATFILHARSETGHLRPSSGAGGPRESRTRGLP